MMGVRATVTKGVVAVLVMVLGVTMAQSGNGLAAGSEDILSGYPSISLIPNPILESHP